jgi:topoisomerase-4 subunit A
VLEEIEELTNPKVRAGKKTLGAEQLQLKASLLAVLDAVRDESSKEASVRLVFEPKSRTVAQADLVNALLAHTSLESSTPINLTMVGSDGRPTQKSLLQLLGEWVRFRVQTVEKRSRHRLGKVADRIHILEGRRLVLLRIDEVIAIIRAADEPKPALIERFELSERQADDILDIRLRQLARLEAIKIEQELKELRGEEAKLNEILASPAALKRTVIREIEADAKAHGDERRTLIEAQKRAVAEVRVVDEPVTVVVSMKGWVRALKGHEVEPASSRSRPAMRSTARSLPQRRHAARLRQQRPRLLGGGREPAERARRRPADHLADRPRGRHAAGALLRRRRERRC